jgi:uncharacterized OB-fold protein
MLSVLCYGRPCVNDDSLNGSVVMTELDGEPRLVGSRCASCSAVVFPASDVCPRCADRAERTLLGPKGKLWTWTVQAFPPKPPYRGGSEFEPFGVGYVELEEGLRVETRLTEADPAKLRIGMPVELVVVDVPGFDDGRVTFAFQPSAAP